MVDVSVAEVITVVDCSEAGTVVVIADVSEESCDV
jgi:hypothetical protein